MGLRKALEWILENVRFDAVKVTHPIDVDEKYWVVGEITVHDGKIEIDITYYEKCGNIYYTCNSRDIRVIAEKNGDDEITIKTSRPLMPYEEELLLSLLRIFYPLPA